MGGYGDVQMIDENGIRVDGRTAEGIRPVEISAGVIPVADGSAEVIVGWKPCDCCSLWANGSTSS